MITATVSRSLKIWIPRVSLQKLLVDQTTSENF